MAFTLRLPADLDAALNELSQAEHLSKHDLAVQALATLVHERSHRSRFARALAETDVVYQDALRRLGE